MHPSLERKGFRKINKTKTGKGNDPAVPTK